MRKTVFGAVERDLESDIPGRDGAERDANMITRMQQYVSSADTSQPLFLFLFWSIISLVYYSIRDRR